MSKGCQTIAIIGGGIIGLSCAWEMAQRGADVTIFEEHWPPRGASWAAAGMLAPAYEAASEDGAHPKLFDLCLESAARWPGFATELSTASGLDLEFRDGPTLAIAMDADEAVQLSQLQEMLAARDIPFRRLFRGDVAKLERGVSPDMEEALLLPSDGVVNPRMVLQALRLAIEAHGGKFRVGESGAGAEHKDEAFDAVLTATGSETRGAVSAVKGVMLAFRRSDLPLDHVIRCGAEYALPRGQQVLVGATVGEVPDPRAFLLSKVVRFLPRIRSAALVDQWSGVRPRTYDHAPMMGTAADGGYVASGHYRNGILLAPITAQIMADMILENKAGDLAAAFTPARFGHMA